MKKPIILILVLGIILSMNSNAYSVSAFLNTESINIISTSDIHGQLDGYDYKNNIQLPTGLSRISTIVNRQRMQDRDAIIIDAGDFNRGNPMTDMYNTLRNNENNPVVSVMNRIGYDAVVPGNHEFDYGIESLKKIKREALFSLVGANVYYNNEPLFKPYKVINRKGISIGIIGFTTTSALRYNSGDDISGIRIEDISESAERHFRVLREQKKVDVIIAIVHSGIEGIYNAPADETDVRKVAELSIKPDVIISGHSHMVIPYMTINGVIIQSPGAMGIGAGKLELKLGKRGEKWEIVSSSGSFVPSFNENVDKYIDREAKEYRDNTNSYINTKLGVLSSSTEYTSNSIINSVKQQDANAGIVISEGMRDNNLKKREVTVKDLYDIYGRENYILGITVKGKNIRKYVENRRDAGLEGWNNLYGAVASADGSSIDLYMGNKRIEDEDDINIALTGRQLKYDVNIKKSGISKGTIYYNSFSSYSYEGRVRQRIKHYIQNHQI